MKHLNRLLDIWTLIWITGTVTACVGIGLRPNEQPAVSPNCFNVPEEQQFVSQFNQVLCKNSPMETNGGTNLKVCPTVINTIGDYINNISETNGIIDDVNNNRSKTSRVNESNTPTIYIAGYDDQIFKLMTDIRKQAQGHELLIYFHLYVNNKLYNLGYLYTDKEIFQSNILKYTHYFCLGGKDKNKNTWCFDNVGIIVPKNFKSKLLVKQRLDSAPDSDIYVLKDTENHINNKEPSKTFPDSYEVVLSKENDTTLNDIYIDIVRSKGKDSNNLAKNKFKQIDNLNTSTNNVDVILSNLNITGNTTVSSIEPKYEQQNFVHLKDVPIGIYTTSTVTDKTNFTNVANISNQYVNNVDNSSICKMADQEPSKGYTLSNNFVHNTPSAHEANFLLETSTKPFRDQESMNVNSKANVVKTHGDGNNVYPSEYTMQEESPKSRPKIEFSKSTQNNYILGKKEIMPYTKYLDNATFNPKLLPKYIKTENPTVEIIPYHLNKDHESNTGDNTIMSDLRKYEDIVEANILGERNTVDQASQIRPPIQTQNVGEPQFIMPIFSPNYQNSEENEITTSNGNMFTFSEENIPTTETVKNTELEKKEIFTATDDRSKYLELPRIETNFAEVPDDNHNSHTLSNTKYKPLYNLLNEKDSGRASGQQKNINYFRYNEPNVYEIRPSYQYDNNIFMDRPPILKQVQQTGKIYDFSSVPNLNAEANVQYGQRTVEPSSSNLYYKDKDYLLPLSLNLQPSPEKKSNLGLLSDMTVEYYPDKNTLTSSLPILKHLSKIKSDKILISPHALPANLLLPLRSNVQSLPCPDDANNIFNQKIYKFTPTETQRVNPVRFTQGITEKNPFEKNIKSFSKPKSSSIITLEKPLNKTNNYKDIFPIINSKMTEKALPSLASNTEGKFNYPFPETSSSRLNKGFIPKITKLLETQPELYIYKPNPTLSIPETSTYSPHVYWLPDPCTYKNVYALEGNNSTIAYLPKPLTEYSDKIFNAPYNPIDISGNIYDRMPFVNIYKNDLLIPAFQLRADMKSSLPKDLTKKLDDSEQEKGLLPLSYILSPYASIPLALSGKDTSEFAPICFGQPHTAIRISPAENSASTSPSNVIIRPKGIPASGKTDANSDSYSFAVTPEFITSYPNLSGKSLMMRSDEIIKTKSPISPDIVTLKASQESNLIEPLNTEKDNENSVPTIKQEKFTKNVIPSFLRSRPMIYIKPERFEQQNDFLNDIYNPNDLIPSLKNDNHLQNIALKTEPQNPFLLKVEPLMAQQENDLPPNYNSKPLNPYDYKILSSSVIPKITENGQSIPVEASTEPITQDTGSISKVWPKTINTYYENSESAISNSNSTPFSAKSLTSPQIDSVLPNSFDSPILNIPTLTKTYKIPYLIGQYPNTVFDYKNKNSDFQTTPYIAKPLYASEYQPTINDLASYPTLPQMPVQYFKDKLSTSLQHTLSPESLSPATYPQLPYSKIPLMQRELSQGELQTLPQDMTSYENYSSPFLVPTLQTPLKSPPSTKFYTSSNRLRYPNFNFLPINIQAPNMHLLDIDLGSKYGLMEPSNLMIPTNTAINKPTTINPRTPYVFSEQSFTTSYPSEDTKIQNVGEPQLQNIYLPIKRFSPKPMDTFDNLPVKTNLYYEKHNDYISSKPNIFTADERDRENKINNIPETVLSPSAKLQYEFPAQYQKGTLYLYKDDSVPTTTYNPRKHPTSLPNHIIKPKQIFQAYTFPKQSNTAQRDVISNLVTPTSNYSLYNYNVLFPQYSLFPQSQDTTISPSLKPTEFFSAETSVPAKSRSAIPHANKDKILSSVISIPNFDSPQSSTSVPSVPQRLLQGQLIIGPKGTETKFTQVTPPILPNVDTTTLTKNEPGQSYPTNTDEISYDSGLICRPLSQTLSLSKSKPRYNIPDKHTLYQPEGKIDFKSYINYPVDNERNLYVSDIMANPEFQSVSSRETPGSMSFYKPFSLNLGKTLYDYETKPTSKILSKQKDFKFYKPKSDFINWYQTGTSIEPCHSEEYLSTATDNLEPAKRYPYLESPVPTLRNMGDYRILVNNEVPYPRSSNLTYKFSTKSMSSSPQESVVSLSQQMLLPSTTVPFQVKDFPKISPESSYPEHATNIFNLPQYKSSPPTGSQNPKSVLSYVSTSPLYYKNQNYENLMPDHIDYNPTPALTQTVETKLNPNPQLSNWQNYAYNYFTSYKGNQYNPSSKPIETEVHDEIYGSNPMFGTPSNIEKLIKLNTINGIKDNLDCLASTDIYNRVLKEKEGAIPLFNMGVAKYEPTKLDNAYQVNTDNPDIDLKVWPAAIKIVKAKIVFETDDVRALNFIPVIKKPSPYQTPEQIQTMVKEFVAKFYGEPIMVNAVYNYYEPYAVVGDIDEGSLRNGTVYIVWPTACSCGCNRINCNCIQANGNCKLNV